VVVVEPAREADRRLLEDEHPDLVADVEQVRAWRVVRGPDHRDVRAPEVDDVLAHVVRRERPALEDPRVVAVDAADADRRAVDEELVAAHVHPPEPDPPPVRLRLGRVLGDDDLEVVEHGLLGRPRTHLEGSGLQPPAHAAPPIDRPAQGPVPGDRAGGVPDRRLELDGSGFGAEVDHVHPQLERPRSCRALPVRREVELAEVELRHGEQEDVPPDSEQRHVGVPAHVVEHGVWGVLGQHDGEVVHARTEERGQLDVERRRPAAMLARERPVDEHLGPAVRAVAAEEDRPPGPRRGHLERALECRDAIFRDQAVVDHVSGNARRRCVGGCFVTGERPAAEAPGAAEVQALRRGRELAKAAGDVARVHDDLGGRRAITGLDGDAPVPAERQAVEQRDAEQADDVGRHFDRARVAGHAHPGPGHPRPVRRPDRAEEPAPRVADHGDHRRRRPRREQPQLGQHDVRPLDPLDGHVQRPIGVRRRRHPEPDGRHGARRELARRVQLPAARRHGHDAPDMPLAQVGRLQLVDGRRVEAREARLDRVGCPADEPEAVVGQRRRVDVRGLDPSLRRRSQVGRLQLEAALLECNEVARVVVHGPISSVA
jgi:hypothetical protein